MTEGQSRLVKVASRWQHRALGLSVLPLMTLEAKTGKVLKDEIVILVGIVTFSAVDINKTSYW